MQALLLVLALLAYGLALFTFWKAGRARTTSHSLIDHMELQDMPQDLRRSYMDNVVGKLAPAVFKEVATFWDVIPPVERAQFLTAIAVETDDMVKQMKDMVGIADRENPNWRKDFWMAAKQNVPNIMSVFRF